MTPAKILIVEDDFIVARDLRHHLTRAGHTVVGVAARGERALPLVVDSSPDLVLMDIRLAGELDGIEVARRIRQIRQIPVVYLTAYADDPTLKRALASEPFGYILKPFEDWQLRTAIETALYRHAAERKLREGERRYAATLACIGDGVIATDVQARITFMNPAGEALTGWSEQQALGAPFSEVVRLVEEGTREPVDSPIECVLGLESPRVVSHQSVLIQRDGREIPIAHSGTLICADRLPPAGVVFVFRDTTKERLEAEAHALRRMKVRRELALPGSKVALWDLTLPDGTLEGALLSTLNHGEPLGFSDALDEVGFADAAANWHPDDRERVRQAIEACLDGVTNSLEVAARVRRADGSYVWRLKQGGLVRGDAGGVRRLTGISIDIDDRVQAEEALRQSEARFRSTFDSAAAGIVHIGFDGRILRVNQKYQKLTGYGAEEMVNRSVVELTHADDREKIAGEQFRAVCRGEIGHYAVEVRSVRKDGSEVWTQITASRTSDGGDSEPYVLAICADVSERKRLESELLRAKETAESANRAKDEFLANVSHEIRTPMNAILGMTELALDSARTEHQRQLLSTVRSAARNLLNIINDLLDFSKIAAGKLALDDADFSLRAALGDSLRALAERAHRKGLELICQVHPDVPDALIGDAGRLRQVLLNLIGNAIKFTAKGEVEIVVTCGPSSAEELDPVLLRFTVRDTGIGIAREKQAAIFRAFEQEDSSTTRKYGGTGLGLTIASQLVALMGGEITVDSEPGRGSTFGFQAGFARASRPESTSRVPPAELLEGLRVLVVDDNETNRSVLEEWLTNWRMRPTGVADARTALEAFTRAEDSGVPYSLVLLDARMPDGDGITLAGQLRERFPASSKRLILLSSDDSPSLVTRSRDAGLQAYLLKPVQHSELLDTIWAVMSTPTEPPPFAAAISGERPGALIVAPALRILVAEDNELNATLLRELLAQSGHRTEFAREGAAALTLALAGKFDLLLLDLHMPEMDGFEVVQAIRRREFTTGDHLEIVALTARSSKQDRERCIAAGMDDFLAKPIEADALWAVIERTAIAVSETRSRPSRLLDQAAIVRACAGQELILHKLCDVFQKSLPVHMAKVRAALAENHFQALGDAAQGLHGTLATFSTIAAAVSLTLQDLALRGDTASCAELVDRLESMCEELLENSRALVAQGWPR